MHESATKMATCKPEVRHIGCRPTSGSVGSMTSESDVVENVGVVTGISQISQSNPEIQRTSGYGSLFSFPVIGQRRTVLAT